MCELGKQNALDLIEKLLSELAVQIDMFYDPEDYIALDQQMSVIRQGVQALTDCNVPVPSVVEHVVRRYLQVKN